MTKSEMFKSAHKLAKTVLGNYRVNFSVSLKLIYAQNKKGTVKMLPELKGSEKQIAWATEIRNSNLNVNNLMVGGQPKPPQIKRRSIYMKNKEKQYLQTTYKDKLEEIEKCLKHYAQLNDIENTNYFKGQKALLEELNEEYNIFQVELK